jgi:hypothetical protein
LNSELRCVLLIFEMKKIAVLLVVLLLGTVGFAYTNNAIIYSLDSGIYEDMDNLYATCGFVRPSTNRPWSEAEARMILSRVDKSILDGYALKLYNRIETELDSGLKWNFGENFGLTVGMDFALEGYAHSNTEDFITETDWERSYDERKSLMRLFFEFTCNDNFYTTSDIHYRYRRADVDSRDEYTKYSTDEGGRLSKDGYIASYDMKDDKGKIIKMYYISKSYQFSQGMMSNFFTDTIHFSFIWPKRAIFSFGGETWNFSVNRDKLSLGNANFGNLLVDDHTFSDFSKLSFFSNNFKYDFVLMFFDTLLNSGESATTEGRIYMIHTLQFRVFDRVSFTISENVMYKYKVFDLYFFNPSFIYHNHNNRGMFNALAYVDLNLVIIKGLEFYGQFALDQARATHEGTSQSDSYGLVAGLSFSQNLGNGMLTVYGEYTKTSPLLYRRDGVDFVRSSRYVAMDAPIYHIPFFDYIGFPYGGDVRMVELRATYKSLDNWEVSVFGRLAQKGEVNIFYSHNVDGNNDDDANLSGDTPYGDKVKNFAVVGIEANANLDGLFNWPKVEFDGELDWIGRYNYTKSTKEKSAAEMDIQLTLSVTLGI